MQRKTAKMQHKYVLIIKIIIIIVTETDKPQLQTLKWYTQVLYKQSADITSSSAMAEKPREA